MGNNISTGTGFVVNTAKGPALITNRHNVTGKNNVTGDYLSQQCYIPDEIIIRHNQTTIGNWVDKSEIILEDYNPKWIEHPTLGERADFVAKLLSNLSDDVKIYPYDITTNQFQMDYLPSDIVSVIGFPFGRNAGGSLAIWTSGFIASEPDIDYDGLPQFLIDCRSRKGQSGSPVIAYRSMGFNLHAGNWTGLLTGPTEKFLGIYSGRISPESDI
ncbi:serine protease [Epilithonimonas sp. JDS]|uniref:serine protease n=1 Tax=Epilithonimonas sp. JDS TaxID=2902797 RepID=UPI001E29AB1A|nr:serine protease [Epilithonimonas sp. JDS]MCD9853729.1 serine protease [Epilithonimonas sp. JDS]